MDQIVKQVVRISYHLLKRLAIRLFYKEDMTKIDHCTMSPDLWIAHCCEVHDIAYVLGGTKEDKRGIVSCPNYLARAKGVKTAMPLTKAIRLIPEANFIRGTRGLLGLVRDQSEIGRLE